MRIRRVNHIILLFSFVSIALFSSQRSQAATLISVSEKIILNEASPVTPHAEMVLVKQEVSPVCHNTIQKKIFILAAIHVEMNGLGPVAEESLFIKNSLLLVKSYLFFIHPFHHFW